MRLCLSPLSLTRHYSSLCYLQFICGEVDGLLYSSPHIPWRNSILFTEGVIEAGSMFKAAAEGLYHLCSFLGRFRADGEHASS